MDELTHQEARVLGCLIEKALTTPDYYPLTLNALTAACNQKSNREPVASYDDKTVVRALDGLREKKLAWMVHTAGSRVPKYDHRLGEKLALGPAETAVLCTLMLRGPQTTGELKARCGRLHGFNTVAEVELALHALQAHSEGPLSAELPLRHGAREHRYAHLLCGQPDLPPDAAAEPPVERAREQVQQENRTLEEMRTELQRLQAELTSLRTEFDAFRSQFD
jgi:uncharacterized protein YceH (UPF0502 family)